MSESLTPVYQKLTKIASTPSTNDKISLLKGYLEDKDFQKVVKFALSGDMTFNVKALPRFKFSFPNRKVSDIFSFLNTLSLQSGASDADKRKLAAYASIDSGTYEVVKRIITKDLKCGVSAKLVNKAKPGLVNTVPYMRCSTDKKIGNITYPAIIQEKADGMFVNIMINKKGQIKILTRNGKIVRQLDLLKKIILNGRGLPKRVGKLTKNYGILNNSHSKGVHLNKVFTGELLVMKKGKILERKIGNGILNQCIQGTASRENANCVVFRCWDCLPLDKFYDGFYDVYYSSREFEVRSFVHAVNDPQYVGEVMSKRVDSYEEAHDFYAEIRKAGGEGAIIKNLSAEWKDHTSVDMIKMKNVSDAELEIVGWEYGKEGTKYEMCMGAIRCKSSDGLLEVSVGSGFTDADREADWDLAEGSIVTVEFESVIQDKRKPGRYSLFLPRFKEVREDRDRADTIKDILNR